MARVAIYPIKYRLPLIKLRIAYEMKSITINNTTKVMLLFFVPFSLSVFAEESVDFNTDFLTDRGIENTDFTKFSYANYIQPGTYLMVTDVNKQRIRNEDPIIFFIPNYNKEISIPCITPQLYPLLGLKVEWNKKVVWLKTENTQCLDLRAIPNMKAEGSLYTSVLDIRIPQAFMEYQDPSWDPPSRWDDGISGAFVDYNLNTRVTRHENNGKGKRTGANIMGVMGINIGAWRIRSDWQASGGNLNQDDKSWRWNQLYAFRAIRQLGAKLLLGEQYLASELFDSFRYLGASLESDNGMLPPRLQGYAPEIAGVARTNATIIVRQDGRIIYQNEVSPGPFRIQDVNAFGGGTLDVSIVEQDGAVQSFKVESSRLGTLTRPGQFLYKFVMGKPTKHEHNTQGPIFSLGSFSWGASNNVTLYGGLLASKPYQNLALGIGRDLAPFGVLSFNLSLSRAKMGDYDDGKILKGASYNVTYSKQFDAINSQITFAGYRFSQRHYLTMSQFLEGRYRGVSIDSGKELYTAVFGTAFPDYNINTYLNYAKQTYWNRPSTNNYSVTISSYFNWANIKNLSINLSAYKVESNHNNDEGIYLSLGIPLERNDANISYSGSFNRHNNTNMVSYYERINDKSTYNLAAGIWDRDKVNLSGFYNYDGTLGKVTASGTFTQSNQSALSMQVMGGLTVTPEGGAFHRINSIGNSRILVDTNRIQDVPIKTGITPIVSNRHGKAVIMGVQNYARSNIMIDINNMPENAEAIQSSQFATLTEGAIGYRKFKVVSGEKLLAVISTIDNKHPPFGVSVYNKDKLEVGIISDDGFVYLSGVQQGELLSLTWSDKTCQIQLPIKIENNLSNMLLLTCQ